MDYVRASELNPGDIVYSKESHKWNNTPLTWLVLNQGHFTENATLLITKNLIKQEPFISNDAADSNWKESTIRSWLKNEFYSSLGQIFHKIIEPVETKTGLAYSDVTITVTDTVFLLSAVELGLNPSDIRGEHGTPILNALGLAQRATLNGTYHHWWTRSPYRDSFDMYSVHGFLSIAQEVHRRSTTTAARPVLNIKSDAILRYEFIPDLYDYAFVVTDLTEIPESKHEPTFTRINGEVKEIIQGYTKINGEIKEIVEGYTKVGGGIKRIF